MTVPLTVTFRHLPRSGALESAAREMGQRLQSLNERMTGCHIVLQGEKMAHEPLRSCIVKIHISVPGAQIHAEGGEAGSDGHDGRQALRAAYDNAKRQLEKLNQVRVADHRAVT